MLWRCCNPNCSDAPAGMMYHDFESNEPKCDKCGLHQNDQHGYLIVKREIIHYDPPHPVVGGRGTNKTACTGKPTTGGNMRSSGYTLAVTCKACQETEVWKTNAALDRGEVIEEIEPVAEQLADNLKQLPGWSSVVDSGAECC